MGEKKIQPNPELWDNLGKLENGDSHLSEVKLQNSTKNKFDKIGTS